MTTSSKPLSAASAKPRFRVSLRVLLVALTAIGTGAGLLGRLFITNPQFALGFVATLSTIGPFLLAIGTLIVLGIRDKRKGLVLWAVFLILLPPIGIAVTYLAQRRVGNSPGNLAVLNTQQLIDERLAKQVNEPWVWNELVRRIQSKSLTAEQADASLRLLIAHMKKTKPDGWDSPLHWQDDFVKEATKADLLSDPVHYELLDAFYGPKPVIRPLPRVRVGSSGVEIQVDYGSPWGSHSGMKMALVWDVNRVLLNGKPVEVNGGHRGGDSWSGNLAADLPAGEATVAVEVEAAYIDQDKLIGLNARDLPAKSWPKANKRWKQTVSVPLRVYTADEPIVSLSTDSQFDPMRTGGITVRRCVAQIDPKGGSRIIAQIESNAGLLIPVSCDVSLKAGRQVHAIGSYVSTVIQGAGTSSNTLSFRIESLDPAIAICDIILTPNPKHIEQRPDVKEIWGQTITISNVPLERLDLEAGQETKPEPDPPQ